MRVLRRADFDTSAAGRSVGRVVQTPVAVLELRYDSQVIPTDRGLVGGMGAEVDELMSIISASGGSPRSHFEADIEARRVRTSSPLSTLERLAPALRGRYAQAGFVQVRAPDVAEMKRMMRRLAGAQAVWRVVASPPVALPAAPSAGAVAAGGPTGGVNLEPAQAYLYAPPLGIDCFSAWSRAGGYGETVAICDVEGAWNRDHEDLPPSIPIVFGRPTRDREWQEHGTAVLGVLGARPNRGGIRGIASRASLKVASGLLAGGPNVARALLGASVSLSKGDIILVEMQAIGPSGRFLPMLYWDDVYSATLECIRRGQIVVMAAGNGGVDLDRVEAGSSNVGKSSGAILVGAGTPILNVDDFDGSYRMLGAPGAALALSNYGRCVSLQAWGWHVATLGYGDAQAGLVRRRSTLRFSGTSSAAAIVAGAAASAQGIARATLGRSLESREMVQILASDRRSPRRGKSIGSTVDLKLAGRRIDRLR